MGWMINLIHYGMKPNEGSDSRCLGGAGELLVFATSVDTLAVTDAADDNDNMVFATGDYNET